LRECRGPPPSCGSRVPASLASTRGATAIRGSSCAQRPAPALCRTCRSSSRRSRSPEPARGWARALPPSQNPSDVESMSCSSHHARLAHALGAVARRPPRARSLRLCRAIASQHSERELASERTSARTRARAVRDARAREPREEPRPRCPSHPSRRSSRARSQHGSSSCDRRRPSVARTRPLSSPSLRHPCRAAPLARACPFARSGGDEATPLGYGSPPATTPLPAPLRLAGSSAPRPGAPAVRPSVRPVHRARCRQPCIGGARRRPPRQIVEVLKAAHHPPPRLRGAISVSRAPIVAAGACSVRPLAGSMHARSSSVA